MYCDVVVSLSKVFVTLDRYGKIPDAPDVRVKKSLRMFLVSIQFIH